MDYIEELKPLSQLRDPVLLTGFLMRRRAGRLGARTVAFLAEQWKAEPVARIDIAPFLNLVINRPDILSDEDDGDPYIHWPDATIYHARPEQANRDVFLLPTIEPNYRWRTFVETLAAYLDGIGVRTLVSLRASPGEVPHTRPCPVYVSATDIDLELQFGVQSTRTRNEGPSSIAGALAAKVQSMRWRAAELAVVQPDYFPRMPNAAAMIALIRLLDKAFGTTTEVESLLESAQEQREILDRGTEGDAETRAAIEERESAYDLGLEKLDFLVPPDAPQGELPSHLEILEEVERLFRRGQEED